MDQSKYVHVITPEQMEKMAKVGEKDYETLFKKLAELPFILLCNGEQIKWHDLNEDKPAA